MNFKYKGIIFSKELNCSLEDFKKMFASNHFFKEVPSLDRDAELEKVWKQVMKNNGFDTSIPRKSEKHQAVKGQK